MARKNPPLPKIETEIERLINASRKALAFSRPLYSGFRVGAAVEAADGRIFTGSNIENASLGLSVCAERVSLLKALSEGAADLKAIAVVCENGETCYPCGSCRQMLLEFAPGIRIILPSEKSVKVLTIGELLPLPFIKEPPKR
ncbi:MAG: cytidine deaminase [Nitrospiraceae bacterium]|nr:cytidine deaminase [Nitrospiraceae bacterium]